MMTSSTAAVALHTCAFSFTYAAVELPLRVETTTLCRSFVRRPSAIAINAKHFGLWSISWFAMFSLLWLIAINWRMTDWWLNLRLHPREWSMSGLIDRPRVHHQDAPTPLCLVPHMGGRGRRRSSVRAWQSHTHAEHVWASDLAWPLVRFVRR